MILLNAIISYYIWLRPIDSIVSRLIVLGPLRSDNSLLDLIISFSSMRPHNWLLAEWPVGWLARG